MSMIKLEIPSDEPNVAAAFGRALLEIAGEPVDTPEAVSGPSSLNEALVDAATTLEQLNGADEDANGTSTETTPPAGNDATRVDLHGVPYNATFCSSAEQPYYASGKRKGQWKKRQKVDEGEYDAT